MHQRRTMKLFSAGAITALLATLLSLGFLAASTRPASAARAAVTGSAQPASITAVAQHALNMRAAPQASAAQLAAAAAREERVDPVLHTRLDAKTYARVKVQAKQSAPRSDHADEPPAAQVNATFAGIQSSAAVCPPIGCNPPDMGLAASSHWVLQGAKDRKSTRLNSSHMSISYAVFCLKK